MLKAPDIVYLPSVAKLIRRLNEPNKAYLTQKKKLIKQKFQKLNTYTNNFLIAFL